MCVRTLGEVGGPGSYGVTFLSRSRSVPVGLSCDWVPVTDRSSHDTGPVRSPSKGVPMVSRERKEGRVCEFSDIPFCYRADCRKDGGEDSQRGSGTNPG